MCAPYSKEWACRRQWLHAVLVCAAVAWSAYVTIQNVVAYEVAFVVQSEADYLSSGVIPCYAPSKVRMSAAASDEIDNLQQYVRLLAEHDLAADTVGNSATAPFAEAAFDLASPMPDVFHSGLQNLTAFPSPAQQHVHALLSEAPLAWGQWPEAGPVASSVFPLQPHQSSSQFSAPAHVGITLWLTTPLRGGVAKKRGPGGGDDGNDGDNGTHPTASSSSAPPAKKRPAAALGMAVAGRRAPSSLSWSRPSTAGATSKKRPAAALGFCRSRWGCRVQGVRHRWEITCHCRSSS
jgi:hypothetical protein